MTTYIGTHRRYWVIPDRSTVSEFERTKVFVSHTGKKHFVQGYRWGNGAECTDRFMLGEVVDGVKGDVDCKRCKARADGS